MSDGYFNEELLNTEIKHNVLKRVLLKSLAISSVARLREDTDLYAFVDLYAGEGIHEDGKLGSPLIALETIDSFTYINDFIKYKCLFTEIDEVRCNKLKQNLSSYKKSMKKQEKIEIICKKGDWCEFAESMIEMLKETKWGFIFADPFANQINMDLFINILNTEYIYSLKDIMIFVNYNAFKRIIGTGNKELIQKVADFFGITVDKFNSEINTDSSGNIDFKIFNELLIDRLKETNKDFISGFSIPNTKNGKLTNSDYFFLIFCTTDINMVDEFYKCLINEMVKVKSETTYICTLHQKINNAILANPITLLALFKVLTSSFISWKYNLPEDVPTKNQIIDYLNDLSKKGLITFKVKDNSVLSKRSRSFIKLNKNLTKNHMDGVLITNVKE